MGLGWKKWDSCGRTGILVEKWVSIGRKCVLLKKWVSFRRNGSLWLANVANRKCVSDLFTA